MSTLSERMPHVTAFPGALGTGIIVHSANAIAGETRERIAMFIEDYERTLSRFRDDSTVAAMARAEHGGSFDFPDWTAALFTLYDRLHAATRGAIDPCVGEDLVRLGYGADLSFTIAPGAADHLGRIHGRPTWSGDVERHGTTLVTRRPARLDFGACGKGYLVDLIAAMLPDDMPFVINAGGDLLIHSPLPDSDAPVRIALEDPDDTERAIGVAEVSCGAFCASAPNRRHWGEIAGHRLHHLLNAIDGLPVADVAATWTYISQASVPQASPFPQAPSASSHGIGSPAGDPARFPTAVADGLATALFVADPGMLAKRFDFEGAVVRSDRTVAASAGFPVGFFTDRAAPAPKPPLTLR